MHKIAKGTWVRLRTTNGGETIARLAQDYRPTYSICIDVNGSTAIITAGRIRDVCIAQ